jgi:hypothetical protein
MVLRGDAEIGFQQVSELLPFKELEFVGPLPAEVQQRVFFSAGVALALVRTVHADYQTCVANAINWFRREAVKKDLVCANEKYCLLRDGHPVCWNHANCDVFVDAAADLWKDW